MLPHPFPVTVSAEEKQEIQDIITRWGEEYSIVKITRDRSLHYLLCEENEDDQDIIALGEKRSMRSFLKSEEDVEENISTATHAVLCLSNQIIYLQNREEGEYIASPSTKKRSTRQRHLYLSTIKCALSEDGQPLVVKTTFVKEDDHFHQGEEIDPELYLHDEIYSLSEVFERSFEDSSDEYDYSNELLLLYKRKRREVMRYIPYGLYEAMDPLNLNQFNINDIAYNLLKKIQELHSRGLVHGDLKPDNIRVDEKGNVFVIDWNNPRHKLIGTVGYTPPECFKHYSALLENWELDSFLEEQCASHPNSPRQESATEAEKKHIFKQYYESLNQDITLDEKMDLFALGCILRNDFGFLPGSPLGDLASDLLNVRVEQRPNLSDINLEDLLQTQINHDKFSWRNNITNYGPSSEGYKRLSLNAPSFLHPSQNINGENLTEGVSLINNIIN